MPGSWATQGTSVTCRDLSKAVPAHLDESFPQQLQLEYFAMIAGYSVSEGCRGQGSAGKAPLKA